MTKKEKELQSMIDKLDNALWDATSMLVNLCNMEDLKPYEYRAGIRCATALLMFISDEVKNDQ